MWSLAALLITLSSSVWLDVPFTRQSRDGCGSASIWMVMTYWNSPAGSVEEIHRAVFSAEAGGVYASDMERYLASHGFRAGAFSGSWADLERHLTQGRPLIVALESGERGALLHYVVAAGIDEEQELVLVNDPADRKLRAMSRVDFEKRWRATNNWTLLAVPEFDPPPKGVATTGVEDVSEDLERASEAFRREDYSVAKRYARRTLQTNPANRIATDLLATVYDLDGNLEAALKYWNRIGKPAIHDVRVEPPLAVDPVRLDRAIAFSRGEVLQLSDYRRTVQRLDALGLVSNPSFDLKPTAGDSFDIEFRATPQRRTSYVALLAGLPFRTIQAATPTFARRPVHVQSMLRWDRLKERAFVGVSGPMGSSATMRYSVEADGRQEQWTLDGNSFELKTLETRVALRSLLGARTAWTSGVVAARGSRFGYIGGIQHDLLRAPDRRFFVDASSNVKLERAAGRRFGKAEFATAARWFPHSRTDDLKTTVQVRTGIASDQTPIDEVFALGIDRDSELVLHAHRATKDGRKGAAVFGNRFLLVNAETEKTLGNLALARVSVAPFIDVAKTRNWFFDSGAEIRLRIPAFTTISFSVARDLQSGRTVGYVRASLSASNPH